MKSFLKFIGRVIFGEPAATPAKVEKPAMSVPDFATVDPLAEPPKPVAEPPATTRTSQKKSRRRNWLVPGPGYRLSPG